MVESGSVSFSNDEDRPSFRLEWLLLAIAFAVYSGTQAAIPGVNEPHYLAKARHYWQPEWCRGDLFLDSSNPHQFFYQTIGILTWFDFPVAAVIGRLLGVIGLSWSWIRLARTLTGRAGIGFVVATAWLLLSSCVNFSGEWVVGGVEAKVFSYMGLFAGVDAVARNRWLAAAVWFGLAVSFHPVVGGWAVLAMIPAVLVRLRRERRLFSMSFWLSRRSVLRVTIFLFVSAPGLIPALKLLLMNRADPVDVRDADYVQVFYRLAHHLDPVRFPVHSYLVWGILVVCWGFLDLRRKERQRAGWSGEVWISLIGFSIVIALIGVALGAGPRPALDMPGLGWRSKLLKFYPFRLVDALLPLAVLLGIARLLPAKLRWDTGLAVGMTGAGLLVISLLIPMPGRNPGRMQPEQWRAWQSTCSWIRNETDPSDVVWTPRSGWGFKWFAERAEFFSPKDCPQESSGILEWFSRRRRVQRAEAEWKTSGQITQMQIQDLANDGEVHWLICVAELKVPVTPAFRNDWFAVYQLEP